MTNPDSYNFEAECPYCKEMRGVTCSKSKIATDEQIGVWAVQCDHTWRLTAEDSKKLRDHVMR